MNKKKKSKKPLFSVRPKESLKKDFNTPGVIQKAYPFLKDLDLKPKQLIFLHKYVMNNFNGKEAYIQSGHRHTTEGSLSAGIAQILANIRIKEGLKRMLEYMLGGQKSLLEKRLFETFFAQAFYDPADFYNIDGTPAFDTWDKVPKEYRCCVDSLEGKYYGKDADRKVIVMKLVDRKWALDKLDKYIGMTKAGEQQPINVNILSEEVEKRLSDVFRTNIIDVDKVG